jgi:serine/threonine protein phosphatase PrpC
LKSIALDSGKSGTILKPFLFSQFFNTTTPVKLNYTIVSETGMRRSNNEDAVLFVKPSKPWIEQSMGCLAIVADGMGGHAKGEKASLLAVDIISSTYYSKIAQPIQSLKMAALQANNTIADEGERHQKGMGTTCTAIAIMSDKLYLFHIGDSRCYLFKKGKLQQLTIDHTLENEPHGSNNLNDEGYILSNKHILTKSLGTEKRTECPAEVTLIEESFDIGDKLLLCTDGLYGHISEIEIQKTIENTKSLQEISKKWVKGVLQRGAHDNFSFILIERTD